MELTEQIVDEIFNICYLPYEEMLLTNAAMTEETAPDVAPLLLALPNGVNAIAFRSQELKDNKELISSLLDQIKGLSYDSSLSFLDLMKKANGDNWTKGIYEMQKLYALAIAADLINTIRTPNGYIIKRISPEEAKVNLATYDSCNGKVKEYKNIKKPTQ